MKQLQDVRLQELWTKEPVTPRFVSVLTQLLQLAAELLWDGHKGGVQQLESGIVKSRYQILVAAVLKLVAAAANTFDWPPNQAAACSSGCSAAELQTPDYEQNIRSHSGLCPFSREWERTHSGVWSDLLFIISCWRRQALKSKKAIFSTKHQ